RSTLHAADRRDRRRFVVRVGGVLSESSKGYARLGMSGTVSSSRDTQDAHPCLVQAARRCDCDLRSVGGRARRSASRSQCSARAQRVVVSAFDSLNSFRVRSSLTVAIGQICSVIAREERELHQFFHYVDEPIVVGGRLHASNFIKLLKRLWH